MELTVAKAQELDAKVAKLMQTVKEKRAAIGELSKPQWNTSCRLELPGFDAINIQIEKNVTLLVIAIGYLHRMEEDITRESSALEVTVPYVWQNYPIKDWCEDMRLRLRIINKQAEQTKLTALEKQLQPLLSEDQRRELALAEIESQL